MATRSCDVSVSRRYRLRTLRLVRETVRFAALMIGLVPHHLRAVAVPYDTFALGGRE
jgi:hypothetical protein